MVIRHRGKRGGYEIVLTTKKDIDQLLSYNEKDVKWVIKNLNREKQNTLRGYRRDLKKTVQ